MDVLSLFVKKFFIVANAPPMGKERPRLTSGVVYTPSKTKAYENLVKGCYIEQCGNMSFKDHYISLEIKAFVPILTKFNKHEKEAALKSYWK